MVWTVVGHAAEVPMAQQEFERLVSELEQLDARENASHKQKEPSLAPTQVEWESCFEAVRALSRTAADSVLITTLQKAGPRQEWAATMLGIAAERRAVEPLIGILKDPPSKLEPWASLALAKIGDRRAVEPLIEVMARPGGSWEAAEALGRFADPRATKVLIADIKAKRFLFTCYAGAPNSFIILKRYVSADLPPYTYPSSWALAKIGAPAVPELVAAVKDRTGENHRKLAWVLGQIEPRGVDALFELLKDFDTKVRADAIEGLVKSPSQRIVQTLTTMRQDRDANVREAVTRALEEIAHQPKKEEGHEGTPAAEQESRRP